VIAFFNVAFVAAAKMAVGERVVGSTLGGGGQRDGPKTGRGDALIPAGFPVVSKHQRYLC